jgi:hypothetical protein
VVVSGILAEIMEGARETLVEAEEVVKGTRESHSKLIPLQFVFSFYESRDSRALSGLLMPPFFYPRSKTVWKLWFKLSQLFFEFTGLTC